MSTADRGSHLPPAVGDGGSVHYETSVISLTAAGGEILRRRQSTFILLFPTFLFLFLFYLLSSFHTVGCAFRINFSLPVVMTTFNGIYMLQ
jgi:hypothetical protein